MKKVVFCGGGTAGHVMPNIAIIEKLKGKAELHYIGGSGMEKEILKKYPYVKYHEIRTTKLVRKLTLKNLAIPFKLMTAICDAKKALKEIKPDVIFSKGGFVSVPVVMAHGKIPVLAHESDFTMGLANKLIYPRCKTMFFSFESTAKKYHKKGVYSGTPIRNEIFSGNKEKLKRELKISNNFPNVLVVGGSSGASAINDIIASNIKELTKKYNIIHICGKNKPTNVTAPGYYKFDYVNNIGDFLALADIVVSRAGSNAIFEFLALKKPMILIPLPLDQSRGDQILNAKYFENKGWAKVVPQDELTQDTLLNALKVAPTLTTALKKNAKQKNATDIILNEIEKYLK